jgi:hypothetical protein
LDPDKLNILLAACINWTVDHREKDFRVSSNRGVIDPLAIGLVEGKYHKVVEVHPFLFEKKRQSFIRPSTVELEFSCMPNASRTRPKSVP